MGWSKRFFLTRYFRNSSAEKGLKMPKGAAVSSHAFFLFFFAN